MISISQRVVGQVILLDVAGRFTGGENYNALSNKIIGLLQEGHILFVLNLGEIINADSTGIGELIMCIRRVKEKGGDIKIANPSAKIESLLHITNLENIFEVHETERSALRSFGH